jgi:uncharacterized membrane protein YcaP (DUF421 family)
MDPQELLLTALRAIAIYVIMLAVLRISGKRAIGNFSAFDLLVALMLGEVVDEIIYGDVTFLQGLVPIVLITLLQYGTSWLSYWDHGWDKVLEGTPTVIVRDGQLDRKGMRTERMNEKDVLAELRLGSIDDLREVKLAVIENDGRISILKHRWAEALQKGDVRSEAGRMKQAVTGGDTEEEPPIYVRTDSPEALGLRE